MNQSSNAPRSIFMLRKMREASAVFYGLAAQTSCHPFLEFTGLMNEYIKCCEEAHSNGIDFAACSAHTGQTLPMHQCSIDYINEKLGCIFGGRIVVKGEA